MTNDNSYVPKGQRIMDSFTMPCAPTTQNEKLVRKACEKRIDELNAEARRFNRNADEPDEKGKKFETRYHCNMQYEVILGMDNIRVNVSGATPKDFVMIGIHFNELIA